MCAKSIHLCPTLCDPIDCSPPASSIHGILQSRTLEWVAAPSSRGSSLSRNQTQVSMLPALASRFFTTEPLEAARKPSNSVTVPKKCKLKQTKLARIFFFLRRLYPMLVRRKWQPTPVFLTGESHGQRSLVGCCLWGLTELDTTEAT